MVGLTTLCCFAQLKTVVFDYENSTFNENQPLPAESFMVFTGSINPEIHIVELDILKGKSKQNKTPYYSNSWSRSYGNSTNSFKMPVNYKFRAGGSYDLYFSFYRNVSDLERTALQEDMFAALDNYIDQSFSADKKKIDVSDKAKIILSEMDEIVSYGLTHYKTRNGLYFQGFSSIVKGKIEQLGSLKLNDSKFNVFDADSKKERNFNFFDDQVQGLKDIARTEVEQYMNTELFILSDRKEIRDYPVERVGNSFAVNAGYGAVILNDEIADFEDGELSNLNYVHGPYVGISVPLANKSFKPGWNNLSLSAGVILKNLEDDQGNELTGPVINRPFYLGLGYRALNFLKLNLAGAVVERQKLIPATDEIKATTYIRPFVGVSAEFNISLDFGNKR